MGETTLLFRHLPMELSLDERKDLFHHFGASRVRVFRQTRANTGMMANTAFATFPSKEHALEVLHQLHQVEVLGSRLVVEFAKDASQKPSVVDDEGKLPMHKESTKSDKDKVKDETSFKPEEIKFDTTFNTWCLNHPRPPQLKYHYPPPSPMILTNIMNALASVPKFYVQVLHLMNKMDLPCPFGTLTATPPLQPDINGLVQADDVDQREMDISSETESELESDDEEKLSRQKQEQENVKRLHRKAVKKHHLKKPRLVDLQTNASDSTPSCLPVLPVAEVFDQIPDPSSQAQRRIEMKIPSAVMSASQKNRNVEEERKSLDKSSHQYPQPTPFTLERPIERAIIQTQARAYEGKGNDRTYQVTSTIPSPPSPSVRPSLGVGKSISKEAHEQNNVHLEGSASGSVDECFSSGGFGILKPVPKDTKKKEEEDSSESQWGKSRFITSSELRKGRLSESEMRDLNVFKRYEPGETSCRLYIKNVAKQATEKDLHWLFGRYIDWESETEQNIYDIRLMKEGRMKGQAFIQLPSEEVATDALRDTNGFLLKDKPLVVQFARSAKAQEDASSVITKSR